MHLTEIIRQSNNLATVINYEREEYLGWAGGSVTWSVALDTDADLT